MSDEKYISIHKLTKQFGLVPSTLSKWADAGKVRYIHPNENGHRLYNVRDIERVFCLTQPITTRIVVYYARVSSSHQRADLERLQVWKREREPYMAARKALQKQYPKQWKNRLGEILVPEPPKPHPPKKKKAVPLEHLRQRVGVLSCYDKDHWIRQTGVAADFIDEAVRDIVKNWFSNQQRYLSQQAQGNNPSPFDMHFSSKKRAKQESCVLLKKHWGKIVKEDSFWNRLNPFKLNVEGRVERGKQLTLPLAHDTRLIKTRTNKVYIVVAEPLPKRSESQAPQGDLGVVSVDPGVRDFITTFDPSGLVTAWSPNVSGYSKINQDQ
ncbi:uncharacterized protein BJ171DRAFT_636789 [Polychytrium aggregatum]|uniref:uncharacterized protein n=1 Tax=Polychytrium aggregatum TaxID=110093 RepID=UPI0022FEF8AE|nr:uncharacterized protein BJ171DRAFT_636789 [Polychytrium aggregatum]KAI9193452.1 hypothetical protein BJ171DRAFT_636789 [Polychytrium aggregatum]